MENTATRAVQVSGDKNFWETDKKGDKIHKEAEALKIHKMSPTDYHRIYQA